MSGKPKNKVPKEEIPVEDEVPLEAEEDLFIEETETVDTPKAAGKKNVAPESKKKKKGGFKLSSIDPIILASFSVFLIACLIVTGVTVYGIVSGENNESTAQYGSKVTVDYTGSYFTYYDETGASIFDTSYSSIGTSDDYKKSFEFNSDKTYESLTFSIGEGKFLADFENALIGHKPGDTIKVKIPNGEGYGSLDDTNTSTESRTGIVTEKNIKLTTDDYKKLFDVTDVPSSIPTTVLSPYGWDATVSLGSDGMVSVGYEPKSDLTTEYSVCEGLKTKVTSIGANITFEYIIDGGAFDENAKMLRAIMDGSIVYIIAFDGDNTMTYKTADEKTGIDLYFVIKFVEYSS